jgi:aminopeptidase N
MQNIPAQQRVLKYRPHAISPAYAMLGPARLTLAMKYPVWSDTCCCGSEYLSNPKFFLCSCMRRLLFLLPLLISGLAHGYTRQDTLRGSNGRGRDWWDVTKYELGVVLDTTAKRISGTCTIRFRLTGTPRDSMQVDLQDSLQIDRVEFFGAREQGRAYAQLETAREGNVWWLNAGKVRTDGELRIAFHGKPRKAVHAPWDGGLIWTKDSSGRPWIAVACQGLGASAWWPCKDYQGDEPDSGSSFRLSLSYLNSLSTADIAENHYISNGSSDSFTVIDPVTGKESQLYELVTRNPINTYNTTFYYGDYTHWRDTFQGVKGLLNLDFYPLRYNERKARKQWKVAKEMLRCFEYWMGPYPFYEDGYKLVEAPYLGMEHQSAVAYGNEYNMGYRGTDRSGTDIGLSFDYIVVHESGHEWFGNSITARDIADNWIHEGLTSYTETLFVEWIRGKKDAFRYAEGCWRNISNDRPVIGDYGVNDEGSGDKYDKGAAVIHMLRQMMNNDSAFRHLLRGMNERFYHKIITTQEFEQYIAETSGLLLAPFFQQYLRTTKIPELRFEGDVIKQNLTFSWSNAEPGFFAPVRISRDRGRHWETISTNAQIPVDIRWKKFKRRLRVAAAGLYTIG